MNKHNFLLNLKKSLAGLPAEDRDEILYDYEEHFRGGLAEGKTEEEIAKSLGDPRAIAKMFTANRLVQEAEMKASASNIVRAVFATVGLSFFNLVFILGPFLGLAGVMFALFVSAFAIMVSGIAVFVGALAAPLLPVQLSFTVSPPVHPAALVFFGVGLTALGLLLLIGNVYLAKLFYFGVLKYLRLNLNIIKGAG